jgi:sugar/nucleoside kinase (ribokinase family)
MKFPFALPKNKQFDVVGFGTNAVDFLIQVPTFPAYSSKIELSDYTRAAGGEVATTMVGLQRLGLKTAYVGRFGDDREGDFGLQTLRDAAVDISFAEQIAGAKTQIAFIVIDERTGERTVIWQRDKLLAYDETAAPLDAAALGKFCISPRTTPVLAGKWRKRRKRPARSCRAMLTMFSTESPNCCRTLTF